MTFAVDWALKANCQSIYLSISIYLPIRPDMTFAVDLALNNNYLSIYLPIIVNQNTQEVKNERCLICFLWTLAVSSVFHFFKTYCYCYFPLPSPVCLGIPRSFGGQTCGVVKVDCSPAFFSTDTGYRSMGGQQTDKQDDPFKTSSSQGQGHRNEQEYACHAYVRLPSCQVWM